MYKHEIFWLLIVLNFITSYGFYLNLSLGAGFVTFGILSFLELFIYVHNYMFITK